MAFKQTPLPYDQTALKGFISEETFQYHYGKHHAAYIKNLNGLVPGTEWEAMPLLEVVKKCPAGGLFNNSAQAWNHSFFWDCMAPNGGKAPSGKIGEMIKSDFGSFEVFKEQFSKSAATLFGAGWAWLALNERGKLEIIPLSNADTPVRHNKKPLLTIDVWEHAYYIDYRNERPRFVEGFWEVVNWDFANKCLTNTPVYSA